MALKTLEELNSEYFADAIPAYGQRADRRPITAYRQRLTPETPHIEKPHSQEKQTARRVGKKRHQVFASISDMLFSVAIFMILIVALTSSIDGGMPKMIFGCTYFTVASPSMQSEIPQGSFILVKQVDPQELKIGDNITYMVDRSTSVTHKIVDIYENYNNSEARGFQTRGVNNARPDKNIVYAKSVVGKVVAVIPGFGAFLASVGENVFLVFIIFGLCVLLSFVIRGLFANPSIKRKEAPQENEKVKQ